MNQIICTSSIDFGNINNKKNEFNQRKSFLLKFLFYSLVFVSLSLTIYYIFYRFDLYKSERLSQRILNDYNIISIYNKSSNYSTNLPSNKIQLENYDELSGYVIGIIEIKKLDIIYPILSETSRELLKISPCRFFGPNPNEFGNLCIAAHNYKNNTFFSNLSNLKNGDIVSIHDISGNSVDYIVYKVYTTDHKDTECMNQNTNNSRVITLVTCDTLDNNFRTIVKAKEI